MFAELVFNSLKDVCKKCEHPKAAHEWVGYTNNNGTQPIHEELYVRDCAITYETDVDGHGRTGTFKQKESNTWREEFQCFCTMYTPYTPLDIAEVIERELGNRPTRTLNA